MQIYLTLFRFVSKLFGGEFRVALTPCELPEVCTESLSVQQSPRQQLACSTSPIAACARGWASSYSPFVSRHFLELPVSASAACAQQRTRGSSRDFQSPFFAELPHCQDCSLQIPATSTSRTPSFASSPQHIHHVLLGTPLLCCGPQSASGFRSSTHLFPSLRSQSFSVCASCCFTYFSQRSSCLH